MTSLSVPATLVSGWTAAIFSLWGSIATASPSPGTPPGGAEGAHPSRAAWGDTDDGEAGGLPFSRPGAGRSGGHPQIHIEDTPQFYDMEVFNRSVQTRHLLMSLDCWTEVHPSLVTLPVDWNFTIPYGLLYQLRPGAMWPGLWP